MKKISSIIIIALLAIGSFSCKKSFLDSRSKYLGNYDFTNIYSTTDSSGTVATSTTVFYGRVYVENDGKIKLNNDAGSTLELVIDKDGNLFDNCSKYKGQFPDEDNVHIALDAGSCVNTVIGTGASIAISGKKRL
jgi:hypothetical protein